VGAIALLANALDQNPTPSPAAQSEMFGLWLTAAAAGDAAAQCRVALCYRDGRGCAPDRAAAIAWFARAAAQGHEAASAALAALETPADTVNPAATITQAG
jgi:TPR repeat protein